MPDYYPDYYHDNLEKTTAQNKDYRHVVYTGKLQLVLMTLQPGDEIGWEVHNDHDQFIRVEKGEGTVYIGDTEISVKDGDAVVIPAGTRHNVVNTSNKPLHLYTIYAPPEHPDGVVHRTKKDQENDPRYIGH